MLGSKPKLYHYWRSSCSWRVRWAMRIKGVDCELVAVNLRQGDHRLAAMQAVLPWAQVPVLEVAGERVSESLAIIEWLEEVVPNPPLLPSDPWSRLQVRQLASQIATGVQPLANLKVLQTIKDGTERTRYAARVIDAGLTAFERRISVTAGTFCFGGTVTLADLCLIPQVYNAYRFGVDVCRMPTIERIYATCLTLPECHAAAPEQQADAIKAAARP